ncbi:MAG: hypothetical protein ACRDKI_10560 [Solirubrobacterales bacterium]
MKRLYARISQNSGPAALVIALIALVISTAGVAAAVSYKGPSTKPRAYGVLVLGKNKKFPAKAIPKVAAAKKADALSSKGLKKLGDGCADDSLDVGTFCIQEAPFATPPADEGKTNFFYATRACAAIGGWLPDAAQLLGAVDRIRLSSTIDDSLTTAQIDSDASNGLKDQREMSATLVTTASGSGAAGSEGVTPGSKGDPNQGEGDPIPMPANPQPGPLQYVTVYDNHDAGGFAGSRPVSEPERFRCAFAKSQGRDQRKVIAP